MKRIALLVAMMTLLSSASAFAAALAFTDAGKSVQGDGKAIGKLSSGVAMGGVTGATGYAIITAHQKGSRTFGTSHDSTAIYSFDTIGGTVPTVSNSSAFSGWTAM